MFIFDAVARKLADAVRADVADGGIYFRQRVIFLYSRC